MIPLHLKLSNFMAYQEAELDFRGFHLATLTGANGAGKSSLLDAITWALWGRARTGSDDALIRLGDSQMEVEYTFCLHDNTHRVLRKRTSKGRGRSSLNFFVETDSGWRTLTESNIRGTQAKINGLMRLDYDTFINSAFLLQGRDNEFTTKSPSKRKEILSDILGLAMYDAYADRAKERAKQAKTDITTFEAKIKQIDDELTQKESYQTELASSEKDVDQISREREAADKMAQLLYEQHRAISDKHRQWEDLRKRTQTAEADLAYLKDGIGRIQQTVEHHETLIARRSEVEQGLAELAQTREAIASWEERLQQLNQLNDQKHTLTRQLEAEQAKIQADLRVVGNTISHLSPKVVAIDSQRETLQQLQAEQVNLTTLQESRQQNQQTVHELETDMARLSEQQNQITAEGQTLKGKLAELQEAGAFCPVCKSSLTPTHRAHATTQFEQEIEQKRESYRQKQLRVTALSEQQTDLQQKIAQADKDLKRLTKVQKDVARLEQTLAEAEQAAAELVEAEQKQTKLQQQLEQEQFAQATRQALAELQTELEQLRYDKAAHQATKNQLQTLSHFERDGHELAQAEKQLPDEQRRLAQDEARLQRMQEQLAADQETIGKLQQETANLSGLSEQLSQAQAKADQLQRNERLARDKVAAANQRLSYLTTLEGQRKGHTSELKTHQNEFSIFQELQTAFGKKGVQALLIENAIPEIEHEANQLLSRMTDGRMHLRFETQRESKKGDSIIETLDIRISDELGTRDYNLFSGGEAFRINFAIRIAISKILARRAGAQLQTLIIDEGFGSQDGQGRERLVEAINRIQNDFEKVIVITHVEELKDTFPVRIEVQKKSAGSQLTVRSV